MKRIILLTLSIVLLTAGDIFGQNYQLNVSLASLTTVSPSKLVRYGEECSFSCEFTTGSRIASLESLLNSQLASAGITDIHFEDVTYYLQSTRGHLSVVFDPIVNTSSSSKSICLVMSGRSYTLKITVDSDGELDTFELAGNWLDYYGDDFSLRLTGSQPGVSYTLFKNGVEKHTWTGTGQPIAIGTFIGRQHHGEYHVVASYEGWDDRETGRALMVRRSDIGGSSYVAEKTLISDISGAFYTDVTYYNGLGYPSQEIQIEGASDNMDLVKPVVYDAMLRADATDYLPYPSSHITGHFIDNVLEEQATFYISNTAPYCYNEFEPGPAGRIVSSRNAGKLHYNNDKRVYYGYGTCSQADQILRLEYSYGTNSEEPSVMKNGYYATNELSYMRIISEENDTTYVYSDSFGTNVLDRRISDGLCHDTYYIYDLKDSLVCVVQPEGTSMIGDGFTFGDSFCQDFCFTYRYDAHGNITEKHIPGAGNTMYWYDNSDRLVLQADSEMIGLGIYKYFLYDQMGRVTEEGYGTLTCTCDALCQRLETGETPATLISSEAVTRQVTYYSSPTDLAIEIPAGSIADTSQVDKDYCKTLPRSEILFSEPFINEGVFCIGTYSKEKQFYYDSNGRITLQIETDNMGWKSIYSYRYDFLGNVIKSTEEQFTQRTSNSLKTEFERDARGRVTKLSRNVNGVPYHDISYDYDDYGRVRVKRVEGVGYEVHNRDEHGWMTDMAAHFFNQEIFALTLNYMEPYMSESRPRYDGMISETRERRYGNDHYTESFMYDHMGRLSHHLSYEATDSVSSNCWTERFMQYDRNGNLLRIYRYDDSGTIGTPYIFTYDGNRMATSKTGSSTSAYEYASDGNLTIDRRKKLQMSYNLLNLPNLVRDLSGNIKAAYSWLSDGTKVSVRDAGASGLAYRGSFVFRLSEYGAESLESISYQEGRLLATSSVDGGATTEFIDTWHVTDHLGSVRAVVDISGSSLSSVSSAVLEQNRYYPFGERTGDESGRYMEDNRYRFNAKEEQVIGDIGLIDYGARFYDPLMARWTTPDPLAEKYYGISPYAYCNNNPVNFVDPDGEHPVVAGAIIGGAISGTAAIIKGKSFTEVLAATLGGAVDGVIGTLGGGVGGKLFMGAVGGGAGSYVEQFINKTFGNQTEINEAEIVESVAFGAVTGTIEGAGDSLGKYIEDFYSSDETVKSIAKDIKDNFSRRMTIKKATNEAKKVAEEVKKTEKIMVESSTNAITYTWSIYNNLQDE